MEIQLPPSTFHLNHDNIISVSQTNLPGQSVTINILWMIYLSCDNTKAIILRMFFLISPSLHREGEEEQRLGSPSPNISKDLCVDLKSLT